MNDLIARHAYGESNIPFDIMLKLPQRALNSISCSFGIVLAASIFWTASTAKKIVSTLAVRGSQRNTHMLCSREHGPVKRKNR